MKHSSMFAMASSLVLALLAAVPMKSPSSEIQDATSINSKQDLSVFALTASSDPERSLSLAIKAIRNSVGEIKLTYQDGSLVMASLRSDLNIAYPEAVESGPSSVAYVWKLIDGIWQLICTLQESAYVRCEGEWAVVQLVTEMGT